MSIIPNQAQIEFYKGLERGWHEVTEDKFYHLLNCVPPLFQNSNGFVCSEADSEDLEGLTYYTTAIQFREKYYFRLSTLQEFKQFGGKGIDHKLPPIPNKLPWVPKEYQ